MISYINQTLVNSWFLCPERVRRRWIDNEVIPPGIAARIGTGLHKGAEVNHKAKMQTGVDEPEDVIKDAARDGYIKSLQDGVFFPPDEAGSAKKQLSEGVDTAVNLAGLYRKSLAPNVKPVAVERVITMQDPALPLPFRGIIDVLDGAMWCPDLKTAARKWTQGQADGSVQATLYSELVAYEFGEYPSFSFEVFTKTKTPAHQSVFTKRTHEDYLVLVATTKTIIDSIEAGIFPPADPSSWTCSQKWCGYYLSCAYIPPHKKILPKRGN